VKVDAETAVRRQESNVGRYVGLMVAGRAIVDSPILGYGSWSGDRRYVEILNRELSSAAYGTGFRVEKRIESLLPHSQVLQAWVEGGLLGALFFFFYGAQLLVGLRCLAFQHVPGRLTPLYLFFVVSGLWNLLASPFLGVHRVYIACAIATLALLSRERATAPAGGAGPGLGVIKLQHSSV
jgi:O-antigen ligase